MSPLTPWIPRADANSTGLASQNMGKITLYRELGSQFRNPSDILSVLLLLAPEVVQRALAQLAGEPFAPVAFSFGWVGYSITTLFNIFGDRPFMPEPDYKSIVIGAQSGHVRKNQSWIIGRLLRDFEHNEKPLCKVKDSPQWESLRISVFKPIKGSSPGVPIRDAITYTGFGTFATQLLISVVPLVTHGNWTVLFITLTGTALAIAHGRLPEWKAEKWAAPSTQSFTTTIVQGNGSRLAMVIIGGRNALDLEILAANGGDPDHISPLTKGLLMVFMVLWIGLLIPVPGLKQDSWYLLAIGAIGMVHNIIVSIAHRESGALGLHLEKVETISDSKVSKVLVKLEQKYPLAGSSLLDVFYPNGFKSPANEAAFWDNALKLRESAAANIAGKQSTTAVTSKARRGSV